MKLEINLDRGMEDVQFLPSEEDIKRMVSKIYEDGGCREIIKVTIRPYYFDTKEGGRDASVLRGYKVKTRTTIAEWEEHFPIEQIRK